MNVMRNDMSLASEDLHLTHYFDVRQWFYGFVRILSRHHADDFLEESVFLLDSPHATT